MERAAKEKCWVLLRHVVDLVEVERRIGKYNV